MILGSMYNKIEVVTSKARVGEGKHAEVFGLMCYYVLYEMQYMYNVDDNVTVVIGNLCFPSLLIEQCSVNFLDIVRARIAYNNMSFDVIMDDLANNICLLMTEDNLASFEQHIRKYSYIYDSPIYDLDRCNRNAR